jgi:predicted esterase
LAGYSSGGTLAISVASHDRRIKLLALQAGFLPPGFSQIDASYLPRTFMVSGSKDSAMDTLTALSGWFKELNKPFDAKIHDGIGHDNIPLTVMEDDQRAMVSFFNNNF